MKKKPDPTSVIVKNTTSRYSRPLRFFFPKGTFSVPSPTTLPVWPLLQSHYEKMKTLSLRNLLSSPDRFSEMAVTMPHTLFDFSKHLATTETISLLIRLAKESKLGEMRTALFAGEKINRSEHRAVLHTALRADPKIPVKLDGENVMPFVCDVLDRMTSFADSLRNGTYKGYTDKPIRDVVNIGIGGSDLGPRFVTEALHDFHDGPNVHFVSNVDGSAISKTLANLSAETTLVIVASKTFTTEETMLNACVAKNWFLNQAPSSALAKHFVALSTNQAAVTAFGIAPENMFPFKDWVGGRYSLWSAIGLSIMIAIGPVRFRELLDGARAMDTHFQTAPFEKNIPVLMGLLGIWYRNFWNYPAHMILPYDDRLRDIAKFTQQMDMESNGKSVDREGNPVSYDTGPLLFGEPGTDSQHSFMQLVHQGTTPIPADFIICKTPHHALPENHLCLIAHFLAQSRALAVGQTLAESGEDPFRVFSGNRPSTSIVLSELSPFTLGSLIAAYEHKVFVQGIIWNLNSFDQAGVELGKKLARPLRKQLEEQNPDQTLDCSTYGLITHLLSKDAVE